MVIREFPNPELTTEEGILALGGDLEPESLILAYSQGIFPWPIEGYPLTWFCPPRRAILEFDRLHIPRSLAKAIRQTQFRFTLDHAFDQVIRACAATPRPGQPGTWITAEMIEAYCELHRLGHAHSAEVWEGSELVGGVYGVDASGVFAGESMFHQRPNASKFALLHLIEHLAAQGASWIDIQTVTPHMEALGAREIPRRKFLRLLSETQTQRQGRPLFGQIKQL